MPSMPPSRDDGLTEDDIDQALAESDVFRNNKRPPSTASASSPMMGLFHRADPALHLKLKRRSCALGMPTLQPVDRCRQNEGKRIRDDHVKGVSAKAPKQQIFDERQTRGEAISREE